jgi:hypothetical protein
MGCTEGKRGRRTGKMGKRYEDQREDQGETYMTDQERPGAPPGTCLPWDEKKKDIPQITGDEDLVRRVWEDTDGLAYVYIWQCLLSF